MAGEGPAFKFIGTHTGTAEPKSVKPEVWKERMPTVEGIEIVGEHDTADGIEASGTMQLIVSRVLIRKCRHGVHLTGRNRNVIISDSHVYENRGIGVFMDAVNLHQINVTGCHVSYCDGGGIVCRGGQVRNLQITGCDIESNHGKDGPATANVFVDSSGGSNAEVAITGCTVQHNHVAPGSANIRIKGPSATEAKGTDERRDGHVTITGNVLSDVKVNVHLDHARGVVMTGNTCWTAYEYNLLAEHCTAVTVGANNFDRNPRYASEEKPETTNAVLFRDCADCTLSGFTLSRTRAAPAGVTLDRCNRVNVAGLTILDCDDVGLLLTDVTNSRVGGCLIRDDRAERGVAINEGDRRAGERDRRQLPRPPGGVRARRRAGGAQLRREVIHAPLRDIPARLHVGAAELVPRRVLRAARAGDRRRGALRARRDGSSRRLREVVPAAARPRRERDDARPRHSRPGPRVPRPHP